MYYSVNRRFCSPIKLEEKAFLCHIIVDEEICTWCGLFLLAEAGSFREEKPVTTQIGFTLHSDLIYLLEIGTPCLVYYFCPFPCLMLFTMQHLCTLQN